MRRRNERTLRSRHLIPTFRLDYKHPGQAIILVLLMMVMLLGMTAVAIDGGGLLFLRRDAQNAADAGTLSAVQALCDSTIRPTDKSAAVQLAGIQAAADNGFATGVNTPTTQNVVVTVQNPPDASSLPIGPGVIPSQYVRVIVQAEKPSYFAQFVFSSPLKVQASAVARCIAGGPPHDLGAVVGLRACSVCTGGPAASNASDSVDFSGQEAIIRGGVHSNCNCRFNGNMSTSGTPPQYDTQLIGETTCVGTIDDVGVDYTPNYTLGVPPITDPLEAIYPVTAFAPGGHYAMLAEGDTCPGESGSIDPDTDCYHVINGNVNGNYQSKVFEGLYYIIGNFRPQGAINVGPKGASFVTPNGILDFPKLNGVFPYQKTGFMLAASYKDDVCSTAISGPIALYSQWSGIVYAPHGECKFALAAGTTYGAIVCQKVDISGSHFELIYNPYLVPAAPSYTELIQ